MSDIWFTLNFRDKNFKKYELIIHNCHECGDREIISFLVEIIENSQKRDFRIECSRYLLTEYYQGDNLLEIVNLKCKVLIENLLRDYLFKKNMKDIIGSTLTIDNYSEFAEKIYQNEIGVLDYYRDPIIIAQENKIARELIIKELYILQSNFGGHVDHELLIDKCNYYPRTLQNAIAALTSKGFITNDMGHNITHAGSMYVENNLLAPFNDKIFLIAACRDDIKGLIEKVYKPVVEEKLKFKLKFQESSEPKGSIHEDIWEYLEGCKIILCDLTYERPNCFIEYGYALAKNKHIILSVEESQGKTKDGYIRVPFDTQNQKYSFWKKEWFTNNDQENIEKFKEEIEERIRMKLQIIDSESNL